MMERARRIRTIVVIMTASLMFAACTQQPATLYSDGVLGLFTSETGGDGQLWLAGGRKAATDANAAPGKRLAISHIFRLQLPSADVVAVQEKHLAECRKLGCAVLTTSVDQSDEGSISARSTLRIAPDAYVHFAGVIAAPPAKVTYHSETAEDKTLPFLDAEKRLEVKLALRDRLAAMLRDPGQKSAADLALIEKEIAQVQGDIETALAARDYLTTITDTVMVDIAYSGTASQAAGIDLSPIDSAVKGAARTLVNSVAALIVFIIAIAPWLPLIAILAWVVRRGLRRWKSGKASA